MTRSLVLASLAFGLGSGLALAHDFHCHKKASDGTLTDATELTTKRACQAAGGMWRHHHAHCHQTGKSHADLSAKSEADCVSQGGTWADHGHDATKRTAR